MDTFVTQTNLPPEEEEEKEEDDDEWDTDGFVIPSLEIEQQRQDKTNVHTSKPNVNKDEEENIYLRPHVAPPSSQPQDGNNTFNRKQRFKQKLKEADRKMNVSGRENKVANLRELVGGGIEKGTNMTKGVSRDWLDPHCHESLFEKPHL
ncbi:unnamed protein product [Cochlearia groenlandica]